MCSVCNGERAAWLQDIYSGTSIEVDAKKREMSVWMGDSCAAVISIQYCPNCGEKLNGGADNE